MENKNTETDYQSRCGLTAAFLSFAGRRLEEHVVGSSSILERAELLASKGMHRMAIGEAMAQVYVSTMDRKVSDRLNDSAIRLLKQLRRLGAR